MKKLLLMVSALCLLVLVACSGTETTVCEIEDAFYDTVTINSEDGIVTSLVMVGVEEAPDWFFDDLDENLEDDQGWLEDYYFGVFGESAVTVEVEANEDDETLKTTVTVDFSELSQDLLEGFGAEPGADYVTLEAIEAHFDC